MSERLAREIINNTPLSAGDRIDSASPDLGYVGTAYGEGRVSRAALDYAQQLYNTGGRLPDPNSGGGSGGGGSGGGGGGGSDPSPEPDRSQLTASLDSLTSPQSGVASIRWSVSNTITSGSGQTVGGTVEITVDGQTAETAVVNVPPGGEQGGRVGLADVTPGTREVCVRLQ